MAYSIKNGVRCSTTKQKYKQFVEFMKEKLEKSSECMKALKRIQEVYFKLTEDYTKQKVEELGIYMECIKDCEMYKTLCKLLSPIVSSTRNIQCEACKVLSIISQCPRKYHYNKLYTDKQDKIALNQFHIDGNIIIH